jgi:hypothetical protein
MKFLVSLILTALLSFISGLYLPWWGMAFVAFGVALLIHQKSGKAFLSGFAGLFLLWVILAWWISNANGGNLSGRIAQLLGVNSRFLLVLITGFVAGSVGGFAAMSGSYLRSSKRTEEEQVPEEMTEA